MAISAGSVAVRVVPSAASFAKDLQAQILPKVTQIGAEIGKGIAEGIGKGLGDPLSGPLDESSRKQRNKAPRQGADIAGAFGAAFKKRLEAAFASLPDAKINADSSAADRKIAELRARMEALSGKTIGVDLDEGEALAQIAAIKAELESLGRSKSVQVRADTAAAAAQLAAVEAEVDKLDGRNASVRVSADTSSALSGIGTLAISIGALAAIPVGATLGAGILSLIGPLGAAGAGFGGLAAVAVPAISHIKDALQAQNQASAASAAGAAQAQSRALAEAGAQQALASAVRNAAVAHQQALQAVTSAQQQYTAAELSAVNAEKALSAARAAARRQLQDMANQVADAQLAVRQSTFDVADAQTAYNKVISNPQATQDQIARAKLALDQARQTQKEQELALKRLRADQAAADKAGVDGSNAVRSARQALVSANQQVANSERALAAARAAVARSDQNSADQVAAARRGVTQASLQGASAGSKLAASMAALSGPERRLMQDFIGLRGAFQSWARSLEPNVLPLFSRGIKLVQSQLPNLTPVVRGAAGAVNGLITDVGNAAKSPFWTQFRQNLTNLVPTAITNLGRSTGNVATGMAGIVNAFLPYAPALLSFITRITGEFANWGKGLGTSNQFQQFMQYVQKAGPQIWQTIIEIAKAVGNIVTSLAGFGPTALLGIKGLATLIAGMSPGEIQAIALAFLAVRAGIVANNVAETAAKGIRSFNLAMQSGGKEGPILARGLVLAGRGIRGVGSAAVTGAQNLAGFAKSLASSVARSGADLAGGFRNVNSAFASNASLSTRVGAGVRSQISLWRQQAAAVAASTRATIASTAAAGRQKAVAAGGWIQAQVVAFRAAAAAKLADARATVTSTLATIRQRIATVATTVAQYAVRAATAAWTAIQWLLNAALDANPIGIVVVAIGALVAAVIYAYTHFGWFRTAVQATWNAIKIASLFVWNAVLKPMFGWISSFIVNILIPYFRLLWSGVVASFRGIGAVALWLWHAAIHPAWTGIKVVIGFAWAGIKLYMRLLQAEWRVVAAVARWLWHNVMTPVWHGIQAVISGVWNNGIKPVFNALRSTIGRVGDAFRAGASAIKTAWSKIKDYTKAPVNFVIGTVYDKGIVGLWNKVMGWLHLPNNLKLGTVPMLESGGAVPAQPGVFNRPTAIVGEGNPRFPEYVIPTDPKYRGRASALWASAGSDMQMLASGGILGSVIKTVEGAAGKVVSLGKDALDLISNPTKVFSKLAGPILNQAKGLGTSPWGKAAAAIPPKLMDQVTAAAKQIINAFNKGYGGGAGAQGIINAARTEIGNGEQPAGSNNTKYGRWFGINPAPWCAMFVDYVANKAGVSKLIPHTASAPGMASAFGSRYHSGGRGIQPGDVPFFSGGGGISHVGLVEKVNGGNVGTIEGNHTSFVQRVARTVGQIVGYGRPNYPADGSGAPGSGGTAPAGGKTPSSAQAFARGQLGEFHWPGSQFSPLLNLWNRESGWRWNARNPSSGAYGIPQSLPGTKMRSAGADWRTNGDTQVLWGLGYIKNRYGSPAGAWAHSQRTGWYDEGGWLPPGPSLVYNGTGRPEPVFTGNQFDDMVAGRSGGGTEYHAHFDGLTGAAIEGHVRTAFHSMEVSSGNRNRVGRRR